MKLLAAETSVRARLRIVGRFGVAIGFGTFVAGETPGHGVSR